MSFRRGLRLARTLTTRELQLQLQSAPRQRRCVSTASWRQRRPLVSDVHSQSPCSTTARSTSDYHHQRFFSTNPPNADPSTADVDVDGASSTKDAKEGNVVDDDDDEGVDHGETQKIRIAHLEAQIKDLKDTLLRSLAEQENIRRIAARDVANAKSYAISSFAKSLLDTSDNLTRALMAVPIELRTDRADHPVLANLYEGISMTEDNLNKAFNKVGLVKFGNIGEKFDPNLHMALFEYPIDDSSGTTTGSTPPGHIGQVMKVGFMLNDRVIRSAEVGVVKAS